MQQDNRWSLVDVGSESEPIDLFTNNLYEFRLVNNWIKTVLLTWITDVEGSQMKECVLFAKISKALFPWRTLLLFLWSKKLDRYENSLTLIDWEILRIWECFTLGKDSKILDLYKIWHFLSPRKIILWDFKFLLLDQNFSKEEIFFEDCLVEFGQKWAFSLRQCLLKGSNYTPKKLKFLTQTTNFYW